MTKIIAIALAASLVAVPAAQANDVRMQSREVRVADLDLASLEGRETLDRRIRSAAWRVCRDNRSRMLSAESRCIRDAIDGTRQQVALLTAAARSGMAMAEPVPAR